MIELPGVQFRRWTDIPEEPLKGSITRRMISGEKAMLAQIVLKKGDTVPRHSHHNEQLTYVIAGKLLLRLGAQGEHVVVVAAGEVLVIPPNLPHSAEALEDTLDIDVFAPPREDWLARTDDYLRNNA